MILASCSESPRLRGALSSPPCSAAASAGRRHQAWPTALGDGEGVLTVAGLAGLRRGRLDRPGSTTG